MNDEGKSTQNTPEDNDENVWNENVKETVEPAFDSDKVIGFSDQVDWLHDSTPGSYILLSPRVTPPDTRWIIYRINIIKDSELEYTRARKIFNGIFGLDSYGIV